MEEIIRQLEHTIEYFKDAQTDFQRGRVFEAEKILRALRTHDVAGRGEQLFCEEHAPKVRYDWQKGNCLTCAKKLEAK
jgi:hypothetical protein